MSKKKTKLYRQGDVLLVPCSAPKDAQAVPADGERIILAYGEATGHHHAVPSAEAALLAKGAEKFLRVRSPVALRHEEHAPIQLPSRDFRVVIQREYDSSMMSRLVVD